MTIKNVPSLVAEVCERIREFTDVAVVGMSGGVDSSMVTALCTLALGKENVVGLHMPYNQKDSDTFNSRSQKLATKLGIKNFALPINLIANEIVDAIDDFAIKFKNGDDAPTPSTLNAGNARSRSRMTVLYGVASHLNEQLQGKRVRVMGTGNMSEDYIGYDTKGGDALADIFPIGDLFKSEVYQLAEYLVSTGLIDEEHIDRVPSAGLWDGQTDEQELGHTYNSMEPVIKAILKGEVPVDAELAKFVVGRHNANKHKHLAPPVIALRATFCD